MATKRIETQLTIKAVDQYSARLKQMQSVTGRFAGKVRTDLAGLQRLRGPLQLIEDFRKQQGVVRESGAALDGARERVRQLRHEITTTAKPSAQLRREFDRARASVERLEQKHGKGREVLRGLQVQMQEAGVDTRDLAGEQRRLAGALDQGTTAFGRQMAKMKRMAEMQERIAEGRARMERALASSANLSFVGFASMQTGRGIMTGLSGPIRQAVAFESAMSDVKKVVDFDSPDGLQQMSDAILEMSGRIPMAAEGLAAIVASGGQSGLAKDELLTFAELAAKVGVAFDISAQESGDAMANIKTALGTSLAETERLFDAMNHLSNKMASSAPKVLDFTKRVAVDGEVKGFSATQTMAFGSAMIAAGTDADVAATSFRNMGKALARGDGATDRQAAAFKRLGLRAGQVARDMQADAVATTIDVMERINALPDHLQASITSDLFGDEARALAPLINKMSLLRDSLALVNDERTYAGSAEAEYAARAETTANNIQLMQNKMAQLGITVGDALLPPLNDLLDTVAPIIERTTEWAKANQPLVKFLMAGAAATGALAVAGGVLMTAAAGLIGSLAVLRFGLVGFGARAGLAAGELGLVSGAFRKLVRLPKFALASLITPLKWTGALLPNFAPALARFVGFRRDATDQMARLETQVAVKSAAMQRSLNRVKWGAFGAGVMTFLTMRNLPETPEALQEFQEANRRTLDRTLRSVPGLGWFMGRYEKAVEALHGPLSVDEAFLPRDPELRSAAQLVQGAAGQADLPTATRLARLREDVAAFTAEAADAKAALDALPEAGLVPDPRRTLAEAELRAAEAGLQRARDALTEAEAQSVALIDALRVLDDTDASPEVSTESLDRALEKVRALAAQIRGLPGGAVGNGTGALDLQERATGGPFGRKPLLVGERGPELYFPNRSGFIATNRDLLRMRDAARGVRLASAAALAGTVAAGPVAAAGAPAGASVGAGIGAGIGNVRVEINGGINVTVPSGVTDPDAIVDRVEARLGDRLAATIAASFSG